MMLRVRRRRSVERAVVIALALDVGLGERPGAAPVFISHRIAGPIVHSSKAGKRRGWSAEVF